MPGAMGPGMGGSGLSMPGGGMGRSGPIRAGGGMPGSRPGGAGSGGGPPGNPAAPGSGATENDGMIIIKVDSDKLPKASDLKSHLFPTTLSIQVADQEIRFISRSAFPDPSVLIGMVPAFGMMPKLPIFDQIPTAPPGAAADAAAGQTTTAPAAPGAQPQGPPGGRPGGRRGRGDR
jgi:hypothetical protein